MVDIRLRVQRVRKIKGRYFWWPTPAVKALGFASEPLGAEIEPAIARANTLNAQVKAIRERPDPDRPAGARPGSVAELIRYYRKSPKWTESLAEETKKTYGSILDRIEKVSGTKSVAGITKGDMVKVYEKLTKRGLATAHAHMRIWRLLLGYAVKRGMRPDNPASKMELVTPKARRILWAADQVETFATTAERLGRPSMALAVRLAYEMVQRQTDIRRLHYDDWKGDGFDLAQSKTTQRVWSPIRPRLAKALNKGKAAGGFVVIAENTGQPYKRYHFQHEFARIRGAAGLPDYLQFRDIRRTGLTEQGSGGATDDQIRASSGHKTRNQVATYVVPNRKMSEEAQRKRWAGNKKVITDKGEK